MTIKTVHNLSLTTLVSLLLVACVTINVYFPAAAAEKAADRIIDNVWGQEQPFNPSMQPNSPDPSQQPATQQPQSSLETPFSTHSFTFLLSSEWLISTARAAEEANLNISTPAIESLQTTMADRHKQLEPFYDNGAIGLTSDALITVRDLNSVPLKSRKDVKTWVEEENQDRLSLYREIAVANKHPEWESNIRATFATRWIERAQAGWWYQNAKGAWQAK